MAVNNAAGGAKNVTSQVSQWIKPTLSQDLPPRQAGSLAIACARMCACAFRSACLHNHAPYVSTCQCERTHLNLYRATCVYLSTHCVTIAPLCPIRSGSPDSQALEFYFCLNVSKLFILSNAVAVATRCSARTKMTSVFVGRYTHENSGYGAEASRFF